LNHTFKKIAVITIVFILTTTAIFVFFIIPHIHEALMDERKQTLHEISNFFTTMFYELNEKEKAGKLQPGEAQALALHMVNSFRYGENNDDYFWINTIDDGTMIAHPFEYLRGQNVEELVDVEGYNFGKDMLDIARHSEHGFIAYQWPSKNSANVYVPKISHIATFQPWNWMIGTGIYIDDVQQEVSTITKKIIGTFVLILMLMIGLLVFIIRAGARIEAQKNLIQLEFMSLIQHLPIGVFRIELTKNDENKPPIIWNQALTNLFELPTKNYLGQTNMKMSDFFTHTEYQDSIVETILKDGQIIGNEYQIRTFKGNSLWIKLFGQLVKKDGRLYLDASVENITDKRKAQELLKKSYDELKKIDQMKNEIISITSHELRTPLTIIKGFASLLSHENVGSLNEDQKNQQSKIITNTDKLLEMITNMLDLERLESDKMQFQIEETNLNDLLRETYTDFQERCKMENKKITLDLPDDPMIIDTDPQQMKRIFINLIDNAIKFTNSEHGIITIFTKKLDSNKIEIHVTDNGFGIAKNDLDGVFEKFKQIDNHVERVYSGSGLGLPIVKKLATGLAATINVKSAVGKGSDFYITVSTKK